MIHRPHRLPPLLCALLLVLPGMAGAGQPPGLAASNELATGGFYRLQWDGPPGATFEVEEALDAHFSMVRRVYRGADTATVLSGRPDGEYHYRVRLAGDERGPGAWSETATVTVAHHGLGRAFAFFAVGALVFLVLVTVIVRGAREPGR